MADERRTLGAYHILNRLGQGGMAVVYLALDQHDRQVALKVLHRHLAFDPMHTSRFELEARAAAVLYHPNIVPVYDSGRADGDFYIAMAYVPGGTLKDLLDQGALEMAYAARLIRKLASALDYAHSEHVVHRDVKPSNVLMQSPELPRLADFGLAKIVTMDAAISLTTHGVPMGTARYMAPEQARDAARVNGRADIYSLGVILYEMLTGCSPFQAETPAEMIVKHMYHAPPAASLTLPHLPPVVDRILLKALAKHPDDRFESAGALAGAFEDAVAGRPLTVDLALAAPRDDETEFVGQGTLPAVDISALFEADAAQAGESGDVAALLTQMTPLQRSLFNGALQAYDEGDVTITRLILQRILEQDHSVAAAWILRSYVEDNWYDQMQCAENALAVAPALEDARLRIDQLKVERLPASIGRTHSLIPAVRSEHDRVMDAYFQESRLEEDDDALDSPYQCPYCGVVNAPERARCTSCRRSLMRIRPPDPRPSQALHTARSLTLGGIVMVLLQLFPGLLWTWYEQIETGTRLKWSLDIIFSQDVAVLMAGHFTEVYDLEGFQFVLFSSLARILVLFLYALVGLRFRSAVSFFAGISVYIIEIAFGLLIFARGWTGLVSGVGGALVAGWALLALLRATSNFAVTTERMLVKADLRLKSGLAYWRMGGQYEREGKWALAVAHHRAAVAAAPERAEYYKSLGIGYNELRRPDRALPALEQALILNPADPDIAALIARIQQPMRGSGYSAGLQAGQTSNE